jgi:hypothetical protein
MQSDMFCSGARSLTNLLRAARKVELSKRYRFELTTLSPLGERVARNRRFLQPGRVGLGGLNLGA